MIRVVLMSGGMDSAVLMAKAVDDVGSEEVHGLFFDYGQRALFRERAAVAMQKLLWHELARGKPLKYHEMKLPTPRGTTLTGGEGTFYVPGRNLIFLAHAASLAEALGAQEVWVGTRSVGGEGLPVPDADLPFIRAAELAVMLGSEAGARGESVELVAPFTYLSLADIVKLADYYGVVPETTWSCYLGGEEPCGECPPCRARRGVGLV